MTRRFLSRRMSILIMLAISMLVLSGCSSTTSKIAESGQRTKFWDLYFVGPISDVLDWFAKILWNEYGLSILVVTVIIRCLILPLTLKQYKSSKKMQAIQPELKKLKEKFKDDPKKQQEETMKLFQKNGVNPLAGCFPMLVQMPILVGLYQAIMRNPVISDHTFLWLQLGHKDPYFILPTIAAITTYLQQKMMSSQMNSQMQALFIIFPIMIFVMSMQFASALPLYWIYSNTFTIVQSYFIYHRPSKKAEEVAGKESRPSKS